MEAIWPLATWSKMSAKAEDGELSRLAQSGNKIAIQHQQDYYNLSKQAGKNRLLKLKASRLKILNVAAAFLILFILMNVLIKGTELLKTSSSLSKIKQNLPTKNAKAQEVIAKAEAKLDEIANAVAGDGNDED